MFDGAGSIKWIGAFVVLLAVVIGVVAYVVTRPPDRDLDAAERAWVREFEAWRDSTERRVETAIVGLSFENPARNTRLIDPLATCSTTLLELGDAPELLSEAQEAAEAACREAEHAVGVNNAFGTSSLATTRLHLNEAGDRLRLAERNLRTQLAEAA